MDEELLHFNWIKKYLNFSDALYTVPEIERVDVEIKDRVYPFEATVDREIQTTVDIFKIMDAAIKEGDYFTINWLYGGSPLDGKLIPEQFVKQIALYSITRKYTILIRGKLVNNPDLLLIV